MIGQGMALAPPRQGQAPLRIWLWGSLPLAERLAALYMLAIAANLHAFIDVMAFGGGGGVVSGVSVLSQTVWPIGYLAYAALIMLHPRAFWGALLLAPWVVLFSGAAVLSIFWSVDPVVTANAALRMAVTTVIGVHLGLRFGPLAVARMLFWLLLAGVAASIAAGVAGLDFAYMADGAVRGIFYHKNGLGSRAALLFAVALVLMLTGERPLVALAGMAVAATALVLARSGTALVVTGAALGACFLLSLRGRPLAVGLRLALAAAVLLLAVAAMVLFRIDPVRELLELLGKDVTLTGRTFLWDAGLTQVRLRPLLGLGFDAFWGSVIDTRTLLVLNEMGHGIMHFHNTFLEIAVQLGALGLLASIVMLVAYTRAALRYLVDLPGPAGIWPILFLVITAVMMLVEYDLFVRHNLAHIVFVALAVGMARRLALRGRLGGPGHD